MKKTVIASVAFAAALVAVSCHKENSPIQKSGPMTISAEVDGLNTPVKTELAFKYDVLWSPTDKIYVVDGQGNHDTFSLQGGAGTTKGTFKQDGKTTFTGEVQAYYPATMLEGGSPVWPASQTNDQTIPMYCKKTLSGATEERMDFSSLGSVLQIVFNTTQANVTLKSIEIKDGSKTMSGAFHVDDNGQAVIDATDKAGIILDLGAGVDVSDKIQYFNVVVPANNYTNLTLIFTDIDERLCTFKGGAVEIARNKVGRINLIAHTFMPFGTGLAEATGIGVVKWIQLWEKGPKFAEYNVGVTDGKAESNGGYYTWGGTYDNTPPAEYVGEFNRSKDITALTGQEDTATNLWGPNWRMPTCDELQALVDNCLIEIINDPNDGEKILGLRFKGKTGTAYANNSIFLPASGYNERGDFSGQGYNGHYWSSTAGAYAYAYYLYFTSDSQNYGYNSRIFARSVRAVIAKD